MIDVICPSEGDLPSLTSLLAFASLEVMSFVACDDMLMHQLSKAVCSAQRCVSLCMCAASFDVFHLQFKAGV
jgi:hypothetical protein